MRTLILLTVIAASAYAEERNIQLANPSTPRDLQELATILRTVGDLRTVQIKESDVIHVEGTQAEMEMSQWMLSHLDRPAGWRPNQQELQNPAARTFQNNVRLFFLAADTTPRTMQETLTILRTVLDTQKVFNYTSQQALVVRGAPAELEAIEWLLKNIGTRKPSEPYVLGDPKFSTVRVFPLPPSTSPQQINETLTRLRTELRIQKVFNLTSPPTMVVRATPADVDRVAAMLK